MRIAVAEIARGFRILSVDYSSSRDNKTEWRRKRRRRRGDDDFLHESGRWRDSRVPEQPREAALMQSGREGEGKNGDNTSGTAAVGEEQCFRERHSAGPMGG